MKNLLLLAFLVLFLVLAQFAQAQTVDEIINKHIEALGGKEKLSKIQNVMSEGSMNYQGTEIGITIITVHNKLNRQEISVGGMNGFDMLTDKEGWTYMPFLGMTAPEAKTAEEILENKSDMDLAGPLVDYAAKGHKAELMGKELINGKNAHKIKLTLAGGKVMMLYLDTESHMIIRAINKKKVQGQEADIQSDYADYKEVEGVKMPFSITQQYGTIYMSSIKVNQVVPESAYKHDM